MSAAFGPMRIDPLDGELVDLGRRPFVDDELDVDRLAVLDAA